MRKTWIFIALAATLVATFRLGMAWCQTQAEMNEQAGREYKAADAKLNAAYKQVLAAAGGEQKSKIVDAELAWIKYRDKNCDAEAFQVKGGSMYPLLWAGTATRMTQARTAELEALTSQLKSH